MPIQPAPSNITPVAPQQRTPPLQQYFEQYDYDQIILQHGYNVLWQRGRRCACASNPQNAAFNNCMTCEGVGWFWDNGTETKMLLSHQDRRKQYQKQGEFDFGTVFISALNNQTLQYADMVTNLQSNVRFSENVRTIFGENSYFARCTYRILSLDSVLWFDTQTMQQVDITQDCTFAGNTVFLSNKYNGLSNVQISVTYNHNPQYFVVDANRQAVNLPKEEFGQKIIQNMPTNAMARLLQYQLPAPV